MSQGKGFQLQERDIELVHHVFRLRVATVDHLTLLSGRSVRALWRRLLKLTEHRYLVSVARHMQRHVYATGPEGTAALIEQGYAPHEVAEKRIRHRERSEFGIRHSLFIADIHTRMLLLTRTGPATLSGWQEGSSLWDSVTPTNAESAIPIRPDAHFSLEFEDQPRARITVSVFLEADRSTMAHGRMAAKITGYVAYYQQGLHRRKYPGMQSFVVATVTETRRRAEELRKSLEPLIPRAARQAYLFIPFEDLALASLLPLRGSNLEKVGQN